jgi:transposase-like protein/ribosomal protein L37AE/L43A
MMGADFPTTLAEFTERFGTEQACRAYLIQKRWPEGFRCPRCGDNRVTHLVAWDRWECRNCRHQASLLADTALRGTRKPLRLWFLAMYLMTTSKGGISAKELQRQLGLKAYQTAWTWLHKLRAAMVDPDRAPLEGEVEADEAYVGGLEEGVSGRQTETKAIVACAVERKTRGLGRVRMQVVPDVSRKSLEGFLVAQVRLASTAITDGWNAYNRLTKAGFAHVRHVISASGRSASELLPGVHRVFALLKRWLLGTHQGAVSLKHLQAYLEEFTFRFNRRNAKNLTHAFQRLAEGIVRDPAKPYWRIIRRISPCVRLTAAA